MLKSISAIPLGRPISWCIAGLLEISDRLVVVGEPELDHAKLVQRGGLAQSVDLCAE
jgi:hypothetical protein